MCNGKLKNLFGTLNILKSDRLAGFNDLTRVGGGGGMKN
jgi:hypothetical protein